MSVSYPQWHTLKTNLVTIFEDVATAEAAIDPGRDFEVVKDRWRPWVEKQQGKALLNIMVDTVQQQGAGSMRHLGFAVTVNLDMYALGNYQEQAGLFTPADEVAANRLDLLVAQVLYGLTRLENYDLGFAGGQIGANAKNLSLMMYSHEREEATGQYAPARWAFEVTLPYDPEDSAAGTLADLNVDLGEFAARYTYP